MVSWRDRRNAPGAGYTTASEFYAAYRAKDSTHFAPNFALSDSLVAYNTILEQNGNDFMGLELTGDTISAAWANTRDGSLDVWFVRTLAATGQVTSVSLVESQSAAFSVSPNPSSGIFKATMNDGSVIKETQVINSRGQIIYQDKAGKEKGIIDLENQPAGIYFIQVKADGKMFSKKVIKK